MGQTQAETNLQTRIQQLITIRGGWCIKKHQGMTDAPGIPDILCCYQGLFIGIEVKIGDNKPSAAQGIQMRAIQSANGITLVAWDLKTVDKLLGHIDTWYGAYNADFYNELCNFYKSLPTLEVDDGSSY